MDDEDWVEVEEEEEDEDQQHSLEYIRELRYLETNAHSHFCIRQAISRLYWYGIPHRLTVLEAQSLATGLHRSTAVEEFMADLEFVPLPVIGSLVEYVRSSTRLKEIDAAYNAPKSDNEETQMQYRVQLDHLYRAVRDNPSIRTLTARSFGSPESICDLLVNTKSLTKFVISTRRMASTTIPHAIACGMGGNSTVKHLILATPNDCTGTILSGLGASSSVETLSIHLCENGARLGQAIATMLLAVTSLEVLSIIRPSSPERVNETIDAFFLGLQQPAPISCHTLVFERVLFEDGRSAQCDPAALSNQSTASSFIRNLTLSSAFFLAPPAVRLLWNMTGLQKLTIESPRYWHNTDMTHNVHHLHNWAEFIRHNVDLVDLNLTMVGGMGLAFYNGILEGACKHKSLKKLTLAGSYWWRSSRQIQQNVGMRLCRVLRETPSLKELYVRNTGLDRACSICLLNGLRDKNSELLVLHFSCCTIDADSITELFEWLLVKKTTLQDLAFENSGMSDQPNFGPMLAQLFRVNKSLVKISLAGSILGEGASLESMEGLQQNKTLKKLIFDQNHLDNDEMESLGRALVSTNIEEIGLPDYNGGEETDGIEQGTMAFLASMANMRTIQTVHLGCISNDMNDEMWGLLLVAAKENKNIRFLKGTDGDDIAGNTDTIKQMDYYLKLNRFGRRLLDSTNVLTSLWPRVLSGMAGQLEDTDALFYFLREYFSRQGAPRNDEPNQPPNKRARVA